MSEGYCVECNHDSDSLILGYCPSCFENCFDNCKECGGTTEIEELNDHDEHCEDCHSIFYADCVECGKDWPNGELNTEGKCILCE